VTLWLYLNALVLQAAAERGWLNEKDAAMEALLCFRRAGADLILTYYSLEAAKWMVSVCMQRGHSCNLPVFVPYFAKFAPFSRRLLRSEPSVMLNKRWEGSVVTIRHSPAFPSCGQESHQFCAFDAAFIQASP
jgi:hypothetical protein